MGNTAKQCRLGLLQGSDFAGDLEDSKTTSGGTLCVFGSHTFVPISWMCKKQTSVAHSSTESKIISLDEGLKLDGIRARDLWVLIVSVFGNVSRVSDRSGQPDNDVKKHHKSQRRIDVMENIDSVPSNVQSSVPSALSSTASESPVKTKPESQSPLSAQAEMYDRTVKPVVCRDTSHQRHRPVEKAHSSSFSEWNIDKTWSSQEWKADGLKNDSTERPVACPQRGAPRFVIG